MTATPILYKYYQIKQGLEGSEGGVIRVQWATKVMSTAVLFLMEAGIMSFETRCISPKGIVQFWTCNKAVANAFLYKAELSSATGINRKMPFGLIVHI